MIATPDPLPVAVDRLAWSLTAAAGTDDPTGLGRLDRALAAVEHALALHSEAAETSAGTFAEVGRDVLPLWPLARQVATLRREHGTLGRRAAGLRRLIIAARPWPDVGQPAASAAVGRIFRQAKGLLEAIRSHQRAESGLGDVGPGPRPAPAFLDALCPRCERRGLSFFASAAGPPAVSCPHCGFAGDG